MNGPAAPSPPPPRLSSATFVALFVAALAVLFILKVIDVLLLLFLAILLAVYLSAITDWLEYRFGMRRWIGLTLTVVATVAGVASVAALLAPPVIEQTHALVSGLPQTLTNIQNGLVSGAPARVVQQWADLAIRPAPPAHRGAHLGRRWSHAAGLGCRPTDLHGRAGIADGRRPVDSRCAVLVGVRHFHGHRRHHPVFRHARLHVTARCVRRRIG
ncbi:MAG: hypothetical protein DMD59_13725 [Gemmatimonadetes bacterium]|nr:MAG: hypothetical protein DMD59_13725 [Gemmatimonadota bacterium]